MIHLFLAAQAAQGGGMGMIIMMVAVFAIMWFFMIRPQQKKQKEVRNFQNAIEAGTEVITGGGVYGKVKSVDHAAGKVQVEVSHGVVITVDKNYVFAAAQDMPVR